MELKDFISETLVQITEGIIEAKRRLNDKDVIINPDQTFGEKGHYWIGKKQEHGPVVRRVQEIEMKIVLSSVKEFESGGKGKFHIGVFALDAGCKGSDTEANENYVKFTIPVSLPTSKYSGE